MINNIQHARMIPIRRHAQRVRKCASEQDSIRMCIIDKTKKELKFTDSKVFIEVCRFLNDSFGLEFYEEEDRDF